MHKMSLEHTAETLIPPTTTSAQPPLPPTTLLAALTPLITTTLCPEEGNILVNVNSTIITPTVTAAVSSAKDIDTSRNSDSGKSSSCSPTLLDCSFDSGIAGVLLDASDMQLHKRIQQCQRILLALERDREHFGTIRNRLSKISERKKKKTTESECLCNVCCAEINPEDPKTFVKCYVCQKYICRSIKCADWLPKTAQWECELCQTSKESLAQTSSWVADQLSFNQQKLVYPMRARSEIFIPISECNDSSIHFESVSQIGANSALITAEQRLKIREYVEEIVSSLLGGSLDTISVNQLSKSENYLPVPKTNGHHYPNGSVVSPRHEEGATLSRDSTPGPDFTDISEARLRNMIQKIIAETVDMPPLSKTHAVSEIALDRPSKMSENMGLTNGHRHRTEHYFEPTIYQDLLATAVLNKIVDKQSNNNTRNMSESSPDLSHGNGHDECEGERADVLDQNYNIENQSVTSGSSVEPRSDCSYTDTEPIVTTHDDKSSEFVLDAGRDSALSDYIAAHMVPLPDLSTMATESEEDDYMSVTSSAVGDSNWENNWLFKKKKSTLSGSVAGSGVGMLVPDPKEDVRAQIGDKTADEISDLSELGSDTDDSASLDLLRTKLDPINDRLFNKHLIGGQNSKMVLDELIERSSMISNTLPTDQEPPYTETRNENVDAPNRTEAINCSVTNQQNDNNNQEDQKNLEAIMPPAGFGDASSNPLTAGDEFDSESEGCTTGYGQVEVVEPTIRSPSVVEILAAIALGPMLAVPAADEPAALSADELQTLNELKDLALSEIKARTLEMTSHILGVIPEEMGEFDLQNFPTPDEMQGELNLPAVAEDNGSESEEVASKQSTVAPSMELSENVAAPTESDKIKDCLNKTNIAADEIETEKETEASAALEQQILSGPSDTTETSVSLESEHKSLADPSEGATVDKANDLPVVSLTEQIDKNNETDAVTETSVPDEPEQQSPAAPSETKNLSTVASPMEPSFDTDSPTELSPESPNVSLDKKATETKVVTAVNEESSGGPSETSVSCELEIVSLASPSEPTEILVADEPEQQSSVAPSKQSAVASPMEPSVYTDSTTDLSHKQESPSVSLDETAIVAKVVIATIEDSSGCPSETTVSCEPEKVSLASPPEATKTSVPVKSEQQSPVAVANRSTVASLLEPLVDTDSPTELSHKQESPNVDIEVNNESSGGPSETSVSCERKQEPLASPPEATETSVSDEPKLESSVAPSNQSTIASPLEPSVDTDSSSQLSYKEDSPSVSLEEKATETKVDTAVNEESSGTSISCEPKQESLASPLEPTETSIEGEPEQQSSVAPANQSTVVSPVDPTIPTELHCAGEIEHVENATLEAKSFTTLETSISTDITPEPTVDPVDTTNVSATLEPVLPIQDSESILSITKESNVESSSACITEDTTEVTTETKSIVDQVPVQQTVVTSNQCDETSKLTDITEQKEEIVPIPVVTINIETAKDVVVSAEQNFCKVTEDVAVDIKAPLEVEVKVMEGTQETSESISGSLNVEEPSVTAKVPKKSVIESETSEQIEAVSTTTTSNIPEQAVLIVETVFESNEETTADKNKSLITTETSIPTVPAQKTIEAPELSETSKQIEMCTSEQSITKTDEITITTESKHVTDATDNVSGPDKPSAAALNAITLPTENISPETEILSTANCEIALGEIDSTPSANQTVSTTSIDIKEETTGIAIETNKTPPTEEGTNTLPIPPSFISESPEQSKDTVALNPSSEATEYNETTIEPPVDLIPPPPDNFSKIKDSETTTITCTQALPTEVVLNETSEVCVQLTSEPIQQIPEPVCAPVSSDNQADQNITSEKKITAPDNVPDNITFEVTETTIDPPVDLIPPPPANFSEITDSETTSITCIQDSPSEVVPNETGAVCVQLTSEPIQQIPEPVCAPVSSDDQTDQNITSEKIITAPDNVSANITSEVILEEFVKTTPVILDNSALDSKSDKILSEVASAIAENPEVIVPPLEESKVDIPPAIEVPKITENVTIIDGSSVSHSAANEKVQSIQIPETITTTSAELIAAEITESVQSSNENVIEVTSCATLPTFEEIPLQAAGESATQSEDKTNSEYSVAETEKSSENSAIIAAAEVSESVASSNVEIVENTTTSPNLTEESANQSRDEFSTSATNIEAATSDSMPSSNVNVVDIVSSLQTSQDIQLKSEEESATTTEISMTTEINSSEISTELVTEALPPPPPELFGNIEGTAPSFPSQLSDLQLKTEEESATTTEISMTTEINSSEISIELVTEALPPPPPELFSNIEQTAPAVPSQLSEDTQLKTTEEQTIQQIAPVEQSSEDIMSKSAGGPATTTQPDTNKKTSPESSTQVIELSSTTDVKNSEKEPDSEIETYHAEDLPVDVTGTIAPSSDDASLKSLKEVSTRQEPVDGLVKPPEESLVQEADTTTTSENKIVDAMEELVIDPIPPPPVELYLPPPHSSEDTTLPEADALSELIPPPSAELTANNLGIVPPPHEEISVVNIEPIPPPPMESCEDSVCSELILPPPPELAEDLVNNVGIQPSLEEVTADCVPLDCDKTHSSTVDVTVLDTVLSEVIEVQHSLKASEEEPATEAMVPPPIEYSPASLIENPEDKAESIPKPEEISPHIEQTANIEEIPTAISKDILTVEKDQTVDTEILHTVALLTESEEKSMETIREMDINCTPIEASSEVISTATENSKSEHITAAVSADNGDVKVSAPETAMAPFMKEELTDPVPESIVPQAEALEGLTEACTDSLSSQTENKDVAAATVESTEISAFTAVDSKPVENLDSKTSIPLPTDISDDDTAAEVVKASVVEPIIDGTELTSCIATVPDNLPVPVATAEVTEAVENNDEVIQITEHVKSVDVSESSLEAKAVENPNEAEVAPGKDNIIHEGSESILETAAIANPIEAEAYVPQDVISESLKEVSEQVVEAEAAVKQDVILEALKEVSEQVAEAAAVVEKDAGAWVSNASEETDVPRKIPANIESISRVATIEVVDGDSATTPDVQECATALDSNEKGVSSVTIDPKTGEKSIPTSELGPGTGSSSNNSMCDSTVAAEIPIEQVSAEPIMQSKPSGSEQNEESVVTETTSENITENTLMQELKPTETLVEVPETSTLATESNATTATSSSSEAPISEDSKEGQSDQLKGEEVLATANTTEIPASKSADDNLPDQGTPEPTVDVEFVIESSEGTISSITIDAPHKVSISTAESSILKLPETTSITPTTATEPILVPDTKDTTLTIAAETPDCKESSDAVPSHDVTASLLNETATTIASDSVLPAAFDEEKLINSVQTSISETVFENLSTEAGNALEIMTSPKANVADLESKHMIIPPPSQFSFDATLDVADESKAVTETPTQSGDVLNAGDEALSKPSAESNAAANVTEISPNPTVVAEISAAEASVVPMVNSIESVGDAKVVAESHPPIETTADSMVPHTTEDIHSKIELPATELNCVSDVAKAEIPDVLPTTTKEIAEVSATSATPSAVEIQSEAEREANDTPAGQKNTSETDAAGKPTELIDTSGMDATVKESTIQAAKEKTPKCLIEATTESGDVVKSTCDEIFLDIKPSELSYESTQIKIQRETETTTQDFTGDLNTRETIADNTLVAETILEVSNQESSTEEKPKDSIEPLLECSETGAAVKTDEISFEKCEESIKISEAAKTNTEISQPPAEAIISAVHSEINIEQNMLDSKTTPISEVISTNDHTPSTQVAIDSQTASSNEASQSMSCKESDTDNTSNTEQPTAAAIGKSVGNQESIDALSDSAVQLHATAKGTSETSDVFAAKEPIPSAPETEQTTSDAAESSSKQEETISESCTIEPISVTEIDFNVSVKSSETEPITLSSELHNIPISEDTELPPKDKTTTPIPTTVETVSDETFNSPSVLDIVDELPRTPNDPVINATKTLTISSTDGTEGETTKLSNSEILPTTPADSNIDTILSSTSEEIAVVEPKNVISETNANQKTDTSIPFTEEIETVPDTTITEATAIAKILKSEIPSACELEKECPAEFIPPPKQFSFDEEQDVVVSEATSGFVTDDHNANEATKLTVCKSACELTTGISTDYEIAEVPTKFNTENVSSSPVPLSPESTASTVDIAVKVDAEKFEQFLNKISPQTSDVATVSVSDDSAAYITVSSFESNTEVASENRPADVVIKTTTQNVAPPTESCADFCSEASRAVPGVLANTILENVVKHSKSSVPISPAANVEKLAETSETAEVTQVNADPITENVAQHAESNVSIPKTETVSPPIGSSVETPSEPADIPIDNTKNSAVTSCVPGETASDYTDQATASDQESSLAADLESSETKIVSINLLSEPISETTSASAECVEDSVETHAESSADTCPPENVRQPTEPSVEITAQLIENLAEPTVKALDPPIEPVAEICAEFSAAAAQNPGSENVGQPVKASSEITSEKVFQPLEPTEVLLAKSADESADPSAEICPQPVNILVQPTADIIDAPTEANTEISSETHVTSENAESFTETTTENIITSRAEITAPGNIKPTTSSDRTQTNAEKSPTSATGDNVIQPDLPLAEISLTPKVSQCDETSRQVLSKPLDDSTEPEPDNVTSPTESILKPQESNESTVTAVEHDITQTVLPPEVFPAGQTSEVPIEVPSQTTEVLVEQATNKIESTTGIIAEITSETEIKTSDDLDEPTSKSFIDPSNASVETLAAGNAELVLDNITLPTEIQTEYGINIADIPPIAETLDAEANDLVKSTPNPITESPQPKMNTAEDVIHFIEAPTEATSDIIVQAAEIISSESENKLTGPSAKICPQSNDVLSQPTGEVVDSPTDTEIVADVVVRSSVAPVNITSDDIVKSDTSSAEFVSTQNNSQASETSEQITSEIDAEASGASNETLLENVFPLAESSAETADAENDKKQASELSIDISSQSTEVLVESATNKVDSTSDILADNANKTPEDLDQPTPENVLAPTDASEKTTPAEIVHRNAESDAGIPVLPVPTPAKTTTVITEPPSSLIAEISSVTLVVMADNSEKPILEHITVPVQPSSASDETTPDKVIPTDIADPQTSAADNSVKSIKEHISEPVQPSVEFPSIDIVEDHTQPSEDALTLENSVIPDKSSSAENVSETPSPSVEIPTEPAVDNTDTTTEQTTEMSVQPFVEIPSAEIIDQHAEPARDGALENAVISDESTSAQNMSQTSPPSVGNLAESAIDNIDSATEQTDKQSSETTVTAADDLVAPTVENMDENSIASKSHPEPASKISTESSIKIYSAEKVQESKGSITEILQEPVEVSVELKSEIPSTEEISKIPSEMSPNSNSDLTDLPADTSPVENINQPAESSIETQSENSAQPTVSSSVENKDQPIALLAETQLAETVNQIPEPSEEISSKPVEIIAEPETDVVNLPSELKAENSLQTSSEVIENLLDCPPGDNINLTETSSEVTSLENVDKSSQSAGQITVEPSKVSIESTADPVNLSAEIHQADQSVKISFEPASEFVCQTIETPEETVRLPPTAITAEMIVANTQISSEISTETVGHLVHVTSENVDQPESSTEVVSENMSEPAQPQIEIAENTTQPNESVTNKTTQHAEIIEGPSPDNEEQKSTAEPYSETTPKILEESTAKPSTEKSYVESAELSTLNNADSLTENESSTAVLPLTGDVSSEISSTVIEVTTAAAAYTEENNVIKPCEGIPSSASLKNNVEPNKPSAGISANHEIETIPETIDAPSDLCAKIDPEHVVEQAPESSEKNLPAKIIKQSAEIPAKPSADTPMEKTFENVVLSESLIVTAENDAALTKIPNEEISSKTATKLISVPAEANIVSTSKLHSAEIAEHTVESPAEITVETTEILIKSTTDNSVPSMETAKQVIIEYTEPSAETIPEYSSALAKAPLEHIPKQLHAAEKSPEDIIETAESANISTSTDDVSNKTTNSIDVTVVQTPEPNAAETETTSDSLPIVLESTSNTEASEMRKTPAESEKSLDSSSTIDLKEGTIEATTQIADHTEYNTAAMEMCDSPAKSLIKPDSCTVLGQKTSTRELIEEGATGQPTAELLSTPTEPAKDESTKFEPKIHQVDSITITTERTEAGNQSETELDVHTKETNIPATLKTDSVTIYQISDTSPEEAVAAVSGLSISAEASPASKTLPEPSTKSDTLGTVLSIRPAAPDATSEIEHSSVLPTSKVPESASTSFEAPTQTDEVCSASSENISLAAKTILSPVIAEPEDLRSSIKSNIESTSLSAPEQLQENTTKVLELTTSAAEIATSINSIDEHIPELEQSTHMPLTEVFTTTTPENRFQPAATTSASLVSEIPHAPEGIFPPQENTTPDRELTTSAEELIASNNTDVSIPEPEQSTHKPLTAEATTPEKSSQEVVTITATPVSEHPHAPEELCQSQEHTTQVPELTTSAKKHLPSNNTNVSIPDPDQLTQNPIGAEIILTSQDNITQEISSQSAKSFELPQEPVNLCSPQEHTTPAPELSTSAEKVDTLINSNVLIPKPEQSTQKTTVAENSTSIDLEKAQVDPPTKSSHNTTQAPELSTSAENSSQPTDTTSVTAVSEISHSPGILCPPQEHNTHVPELSTSAEKVDTSINSNVFIPKPEQSTQKITVAENSTSIDLEKAQVDPPTNSSHNTTQAPELSTSAENSSQPTDITSATTVSEISHSPEILCPPQEHNTHVPELSSSAEKVDTSINSNVSIPIQEQSTQKPTVAENSTSIDLEKAQVDPPTDSSHNTTQAPELSNSAENSSQSTDTTAATAVSEISHSPEELCPPQEHNTHVPDILTSAEKVLTSINTNVSIPEPEPSTQKTLIAEISTSIDLEKAQVNPPTDPAHHSTEAPDLSTSIENISQSTETTSSTTVSDLPLAPAASDEVLASVNTNVPIPEPEQPQQKPLTAEVSTASDLEKAQLNPPTESALQSDSTEIAKPSIEQDIKPPTDTDTETTSGEISTTADETTHHGTVSLAEELAAALSTKATASPKPNLPAQTAEIPAGIATQLKLQVTTADLVEKTNSKSLDVTSAAIDIDKPDHSLQEQISDISPASADSPPIGTQSEKPFDPVQESHSSDTTLAETSKATPDLIAAEETIQSSASLQTEQSKTSTDSSKSFISTSSTESEIIAQEPQSQVTDNPSNDFVSQITVSLEEDAFPTLTHQSTIVEVDIPEVVAPRASGVTVTAAVQPLGNIRKLQRQYGVEYTTPSFEDVSQQSSTSSPPTSSGNNTTSLASLCQHYIYDKHLVAALENRRRQTLLMHKFLSTIDSFHAGDDDSIEETDNQTEVLQEPLKKRPLVPSESCYLTDSTSSSSPPPPVEYEQSSHDHANSDCDDCSSDSHSFNVNEQYTVSYNFINTILFSDQISQNSTTYYDEFTTSVEEMIVYDNNDDEEVSYDDDDDDEEDNNIVHKFNKIKPSKTDATNNTTITLTTTTRTKNNTTTNIIPKTFKDKLRHSKAISGNTSATPTIKRQTNPKTNKHNKNNEALLTHDSALKRTNDSATSARNNVANGHVANSGNYPEDVSSQNDEEDDDVLANFRRFVPGSIAEREYKKWYNAVEMPNNPYAPEALKRRISGSQERFIDLPNISPSTEQNPLDMMTKDQLDIDQNGKKESDCSRYSRDYYINNGSKSSQASSLDRDIAKDGIETERKPDAQLEPSEPPSNSASLETQTDTVLDLYQAMPAQVVEDTTSSLDTMSQQSMQSANTTTSDDSDTIKIYNFKKQETTIIKEAKEKQPTAEKAGSEEASVQPTPTPAATKERPTVLNFSRTESGVSPPITTPTRGSTPTAFKFLQPKRKLLNPSQVLSLDEEEPPIGAGSPEKPVIEKEVVKALPSVKALAKAFLMTSSSVQHLKPNRAKPIKAKTLPEGAKMPQTPNKSVEVPPTLEDKSEDDVTITSDLSSLETDPSSVSKQPTDNTKDATTTSSQSYITCSTAASPAEASSAATTPASVRQGDLRSNIAFFENLKNMK